MTSAGSKNPAASAQKASPAEVLPIPKATLNRQKSRGKAATVPGDLLSDLGEAFEGGSSSPLVHLATADEEAQFERLRAAADGGLKGLTLLHLRRNEGGLEAYAVTGKEEEPLGVLILERVESQWHVVGARGPSHQANPFQR